MHFLPTIAIETCKNGFIVFLRPGASGDNGYGDNGYAAVAEYVARSSEELVEILHDVLAAEKRRAGEWAKEIIAKVEADG